MKTNTTQQNGLAKLRKEILAVVSSSPEAGFRRTDVRRCLGSQDEAFFKEAFKSLVADGSIVKKNGGRFVTREALSLVRGSIRVNAKGFGFVTPENSSTSGDVFIPPNGLNGAISDDSVLIEIINRDDSRGPVGLVRKILERAHEEFIGCLRLGDEGFEVRPLRRELPSRIPLLWNNDDVDARKGAREGDWVLARFISGRTPRSPLQAEIIKRLAKSGSVVSDLNAIVKEYDLPKNYTVTDDKKLEDIVPLELPREDFTHLSYEPGPRPGTAIVGVHISDVACYVTIDSPLDKKALERGFTSYLPGRTLPMLPPILSTNLCSLREGEKRLAHSILLTIDEETGEVLETRRVHSVVSVTQRLDFNEVERFLAGEAQPQIKESVLDLLSHLSALSQTIRRRRKQEEQFLPLETAELRVLCGGSPLKTTSASSLNRRPNAAPAASDSAIHPSCLQTFSTMEA